MITNDNTEIINTNGIVEVVTNFYERLYSSHEADIQDIDLEERFNREAPKLCDEDAMKLESEIKYSEATQVLNI